MAPGCILRQTSWTHKLAVWHAHSSTLCGHCHPPGAGAEPLSCRPTGGFTVHRSNSHWTHSRGFPCLLFRAGQAGFGAERLGVQAGWDLWQWHNQRLVLTISLTSVPQLRWCLRKYKAILRLLWKVNRIRESSELEGSFKGYVAQLCCTEQEHLQLS